MSQRYRINILDANGLPTGSAGGVAVCAEATSLNTTFVPLFSLTAIKNAALLTDGTHPSQEGHTLIAAELVGRVLRGAATGSGRTGRVGGVF